MSDWDAALTDARLMRENWAEADEAIAMAANRLDIAVSGDADTQQAEADAWVDTLERSADAMSDDIVKRLRKAEVAGVLIPCDDLKEAADEIERLREENRKLREAARPKQFLFCGDKVHVF